MANRNSRVVDDTLHATLWLIFKRDGSVRMSRGEPSLSRDERAMQFTAKLPIALWRVPMLVATVNVEPPDTSVSAIDVTIAGEALKGALGCDIDVRVVESE